MGYGFVRKTPVGGVRETARLRTRARPPRQVMPPTGRADKIVIALASMLMCVALSLSVSCVSSAFATTGTTSNVDADMRYYFGTAGMNAQHYLHKLGSEWVYCVDPYNTFVTGKTVSGVDAVKSGKLSQECVTDMALAYAYVWDEKLYETQDGKLLTNDYQRYAAAQVLIWTILDDYYPDIAPSHNRITVKGVEITGDGDTDDNNKAALKWVRQNRDNYIGTCEYFSVSDGQSFALGFSIEALTGSITIAKSSANDGITAGNGCYSLSGAQYGIYSDGACTKSVGKLVTDASGKAEAGNLPVGTYYVKETSAPEGYALDATIYTVEVESDSTARVNGKTGVLDVPQSNIVEVLAQKRDAEMADGTAQGAATLAGAQFTIKYYAGYYSENDLPAKPTRTWVVQTDENGLAQARDDYKVEGDSFYYTTSGAPTIPLGTVTISETKAPEGYLLGDGGSAVQVLQHIKANGVTIARISSFKPLVAGDAVMRGGVAIGKIDRQNGQFKPQGSAALEGATFEIVNDNAQRVLVDGTAFDTGSVVKTLQTQLEEDRYVARTDEHCLPFGSYVIRESASSEGYLLDEEAKSWSVRFDVTQDGVTVDLTDEKYACANLVIRGDFEFSKVDGQTAKRLGNVPFAIESVTTGERHVIVTDENGMASTASEWNPHGRRTNANDDAVLEGNGEFSVDEELLDPSAGIWFDGRTDAACDVDDSLGALPFDTYTVRELRCTANEGLELVEFTTVVSRNDRQLDLGTVDDNAGASISTSLADGNGAKLVSATKTATLVDTVSFSNLPTGKSYALAGELHEIDADGNDLGVIADGLTEFEAKAHFGTVEVLFTLDPSQLTTAKLVAVEKLLDSDGKLVCEHADLSDAAQTVLVPSIRTTLQNAAGDDATPASVGSVSLVDTVAFSGLTPGRTYTMKAVLHERGTNGQDAGIVLDAQGRQVTATQSFTPSNADGTVEVTFDFAPGTLAGKTAVAFEDLTFHDISYATHADILDDAQAVSFPAIKTTLSNNQGKKKVAVEEKVRLVDEVAYNNLTPGAAYNVKGTLHLVDSGKDLGELRDSSGAPLSAKTLFTPSAPNGTASVEFFVDTTNLGGRSLVAFEVLADEAGTVIATHEDPSDKKQTVSVKKPKRSTPPKGTDVTVVSEKPKPTTPTESPTPEAKGKTIGKTGDGIPLEVLSLIPAALAGIALACLAVRKMAQRDPVHSRKNPPNGLQARD